MPANNTYPPLKLLFTENDLPEALGKFTQSISSIFNNIYYKEYYFEKTKLGDVITNFFLEMVTKKAIIDIADV